jgi:hypothetical protein
MEPYSFAAEIPKRLIFYDKDLPENINPMPSTKPVDLYGPFQHSLAVAFMSYQTSKRFRGHQTRIYTEKLFSAFDAPRGIPSIATETKRSEVDSPSS